VAAGGLAAGRGNQSKTSGNGGQTAAKACVLRAGEGQNFTGKLPVNAKNEGALPARVRQVLRAGVTGEVGCHA
jgi:hypothetical protein